MARRLLLIAAALAVPLAPAAARSVNDTHERIWMPAGKTVPLFREIDRDPCARTERHQPAGKIRHQAHAATSACADIAARDARAAGAVAGGAGVQ